MKTFATVSVLVTCSAALAACIAPVRDDESPETTSQAIGIAPSSAAGAAAVSNAYAAWKADYVTSAGAGGYLRVQTGGAGSDTVSEGIGYGMVLSAYLGDRPTFDGLWSYAQSHLDAQGLMNWQIDANNDVTGYNAATDADEDMALALIVADKTWGGYTAAATTQISRIMSYEVESGTFVVKPGDVWGGSNNTDPSYFAPGYYQVFAAYTGDSQWNQVVDAVYGIIANLDAATGAGTTGLLPNWTTAAGATSGWDGAAGFEYTYDACRIPWRLSVDAAWFDDSRAIAQLDKLNAFWSQVGPSHIVAGYTLSGTPVATWQDAAFTATAATGALVSTDPSFQSAMWDAALAAPGGSYYSDSLRTLSLLDLAGEMPNPLASSTTTVCATAGENGTVSLTCPPGTVVSSIPFASYGTPAGTCGDFTVGTCDASTSHATVKSACFGKPSCAVAADNATFTDPCVGTVKALDVEVTCSPLVCGSAGENGTVSLACPTGTTISAVQFASYGTPTGSTCGSFEVGTCSASTSVSAVKSACVGKTSCSVAADNATFTDPCVGTVKQLDVAVICK